MKHTLYIFYCDKIIVSVCNMSVPVVPESTDTSQRRGQDKREGGVVLVFRLFPSKLSNFYCSNLSLSKYLNLYSRFQCMFFLIS